ncbi:MAG: ABC transporter ATP-binding protein [Chitinophagaceae bacterium]|nr:ABC transporter ATP-binding protein [Chitinophagaceae bacterium]
MSLVVKVENLSKQYRLGQVGTGTISHDVNSWWHKIRGKEDPYLKIGESNDRTVKGDSDYVWALKDINFEVKQGEVLGIIGRNGAGKSTLLKILSRTTAPTTGSVKIKGRVASLLEVGTGFHPELSGRDNIFLNGAILGMTRREIQSKFDEIVDFAGVERYIDTPVKRYSSGMYVRLAFAVAAHLEPEILIVDEVLAVGDAEFQKKCLGKIKDVSVNQGRTVLFVSHNLPAIKNLCNTGLYLKNGQVCNYGEMSAILETYQLESFIDEKYGLRNELANSKELFFNQWLIKFEKSNIQNNNAHSIYSGNVFSVTFSLISKSTYLNVEIGLVIRNLDGVIVFSVNSRDFGGDFFDISNGTYNFNFELRLPVKGGSYEIDIVIVSNGIVLDQWVSKTNLKVLSKYESILGNNWQGIVAENVIFTYEKAH